MTKKINEVYGTNSNSHSVGQFVNDNIGDQDTTLADLLRLAGLPQKQYGANQECPPPVEAMPGQCIDGVQDANMDCAEEPAGYSDDDVVTFTISNVSEDADTEHDTTYNQFSAQAKGRDARVELERNGFWVARRYRDDAIIGTWQELDYRRMPNGTSCSYGETTWFSPKEIERQNESDAKFEDCSVDLDRLREMAGIPVSEAPKKSTDSTEDDASDFGQDIKLGFDPNAPVGRKEVDDQDLVDFEKKDAGNTIVDLGDEDSDEVDADLSKVALGKASKRTDAGEDPFAIIDEINAIQSAGESAMRGVTYPVDKLQDMPIVRLKRILAKVKGEEVVSSGNYGSRRRETDSFDTAGYTEESFDGIKPQGIAGYDNAYRSTAFQDSDVDPKDFGPEAAGRGGNPMTETVEELHAKILESFAKFNKEYEAKQLSEGATERSQNALWAQITDYERRAKETKNEIKKAHYMQMASDLRSKLKTSDAQISEAKKINESSVVVPTREEMVSLISQIKDQDGKVVRSVLTGFLVDNKKYYDWVKFIWMNATAIGDIDMPDPTPVWKKASLFIQGYIDYKDKHEAKNI